MFRVTAFVAGALLVGAACKKPADSTEDRAEPAAQGVAGQTNVADAAPSALPPAPPPSGDGAKEGGVAGGGKTSIVFGPVHAKMDGAQAAACQGGDAKACLAAANGYVDATGTYDPSDERPREVIDKEHATNAFPYYARACELGEMLGCWQAASYTEQPGGWEMYLTRACEGGMISTCDELGEALMNEGRPSVEKTDPARAAVFLAKACDQDKDNELHGVPCARLALLYREGRGVPKDVAKADALDAKACQLGVGSDCPCKTDKDCPEDFTCLRRRCSHMEDGQYAE